MKKIISLFQRNYDGDHLVLNEVVPGAEWVLAGEGKPTVKFDGTCCLFKGGQWFKRYDAKAGKTPPSDFVPAQLEADSVTGHWPGWVPVTASDKWHNEAIKLGMATTGVTAGRYAEMRPFKDGQTYELIGPKINANPESAISHVMVEHGAADFRVLNLTFEGIKETLATAKERFGKSFEGIVWHHHDGRMVKIKTKDFGLSR
jgi:hypothetical protein